MSSTSSTKGSDPFTDTAFLAVSWSLTGLSILLTAGRYVIRLGNQHKFKADDFTQGLAIVFLVAYVLVYTYLFPLSKKLDLAKLGLGPVPSTSDIDGFFRLLIPMEILYWSTIYSVKLTFMLFYRSIFSISAPFMRAWWILLTYIILTYIASILTSFWSCGSPGQLFVLSACTSEPAKKAINNYAGTCMAMNVIGDLAIMALPLWMLKKLKMKKKQKFALSALFLLGVVIIVLDIVRVVVGDGNGANSLAVLWDILEAAIAVIVATLPTYRSLMQTKFERSSSSYQEIKPSAKSGTPQASGNASYSLEQFSTGSKRPQGRLVFEGDSY